MSDLTTIKARIAQLQEQGRLMKRAVMSAETWAALKAAYVAANPGRTDLTGPAVLGLPVDASGKAPGVLLIYEGGAEVG